MVDHTGARLAQPDSTVKRPERQVAGHASAHGPADDAPGVEVEHEARYGMRVSQDLVTGAAAADVGSTRTLPERLVHSQPCAVQI